MITLYNSKFKNNMLQNLQGASVLTKRKCNLAIWPRDYLHTLLFLLLKSKIEPFLPILTEHHLFCTLLTNLTENDANYLILTN